jgi:hypothetical protein
MFLFEPQFMKGTPLKSFFADLLHIVQIFDSFSTIQLFVLTEVGFWSQWFQLCLFNSEKKVYWVQFLSLNKHAL